mmetsp:Transcript_68428/g.164295  ORF Transcript_68428/g.164295 Transcript_68428/m.164295 type:complete len:368 (+) Transcript_68428:73-1176(+)
MEAELTKAQMAAAKMVETKAANKAAKQGAETLQDGVTVLVSLGHDRKRTRVHAYLDKKPDMLLTLAMLIEEELLEPLLEGVKQKQEEKENPPPPPPAERKQLRKGSRKFHQIPQFVILAFLEGVSPELVSKYNAMEENYDLFPVFYHALHVQAETDLPLKECKEFIYIDSFLKWCSWRYKAMGERLSKGFPEKTDYWSLDVEGGFLFLHVGAEKVKYELTMRLDPEDVGIEHANHITEAHLVCESEGVNMKLVTLALARVNAQKTAPLKKHLTDHVPPKLTPELISEILGGDVPEDVGPDESASQVGGASRVAPSVAASSASAVAKKAPAKAAIEQELRKRSAESGGLKAALPVAPKKKPRAAPKSK